jgi:hypothetical protein
MEYTRESAPLDWAETRANTQMNLGNALSRIGERESGTAHLEEAVAAYRAAPEPGTPPQPPPDPMAPPPYEEPPRPIPIPGQISRR